MTAPLIVAGVDVGGSLKGFHAVALKDGAYFKQFVSRDAAALAVWCAATGAACVGVDAPCRWSANGRARSAERELMAGKISCFATPTRAAAERHPSDYFRWMLNGAELFAQLESRYALFSGQRNTAMRPLCFETFPQAIACALAGTLVSAKRKRAIRRALLTRAGVDISQLSNIDKVDAALCALAAHHLALGSHKVYGEPTTGLIVVPRAALAIAG